MIIELIGRPHDGQVMSIPQEFDAVAMPATGCLAVYGLRVEQESQPGNSLIAFDFEKYDTARGVIDGG